MDVAHNATPHDVATKAGGVDRGAYRRDIDGLRSIAITTVVFYHAGLWPLTSGYVGVDIFFVISGFLIGGILHRDIRGGSFSFATFYARRAKRILPALLAMTIIICIAALFLMGARELRVTGLSAATALVGISNIYFWWSTNYFQPAALFHPFQMTWSLGVEEQFYVFFPILLLVLERWRQRVSALALGGVILLSFLLCLLATYRYPNMAFYLIPMRAWEMAAGALLAMLWQNGRTLRSPLAHEVAGWGGLAMVVAACLIFDDDTAFPGFAALLPVAGTLALLLSQHSWVNRRLLSSAPMVGIGLISYSWYLWHAPLTALVRLSVFGKASVALMCGVAIISLGFAYLSWRFVEKPFRHKMMPDHITLRRYGLALVLCTAVPAAFFLLGGLPQRLSPFGRDVERTLTRGQSNPCLVSYGVVQPNVADGCHAPRPGASGGVALLGDSHAGALGPGLQTVARDQRVVLHQFEKSSCLPLLGATRAMAQYPRHAGECAAYNRRIFDIVSRDSGIGTVVMTGYWSAGTAGKGSDSRLVRSDGSATNAVALLRSALAETVRRYQAAGKRVIVVADVPLFLFDPGKEAMSEVLPLRRRLREWLGMPSDIADGIAAHRWVRPSTPADRAVQDAARSVPGVVFVNPADRLCRAEGCLYNAGLPYYIDFQHLSQEGAAYAVRGLQIRADAVR